MNENKIKQIIKNTEVILLDMDGTIYVDREPIGDMVNTLNALRKANKKLVFLTNNSSKTASEYESVLKDIKMFKKGDLIYTSALSTIEYLNTNYKGKSVYLLSTEPVREEFLKGKVKLVDDNPDVCVLAYDTTLSFEKIKTFNEFLVGGAVYIVTHPDFVCPMPKVYMPDVGSFIKMFECSSNRLPDAICGKPESIMGDCIKQKLSVECSKVLMVGDRLSTDINFANNNKFNSLLVLSGETDSQLYKKSKIKATFVFDSLNDIVRFL